MNECECMCMWCVCVCVCVCVVIVKRMYCLGLLVKSKCAQSHCPWCDVANDFINAPNEYEFSGMGFPDGAHCVMVLSSTIQVDPDPPSISLWMCVCVCVCVCVYAGIKGGRGYHHL